MSKTIFVTVSDARPFFLKTPESTFGKRPKDGKFGQYQNIIREHLDSNPEFGITDQYHLTHDEFSKTDFYSKNYDFLSDPDPDNNGRAFKPYAIREALRKINDGDYLIYNDCSPTWWTHIDANPTQKIDKKRYNLELAKVLCKSNGGILTAYGVAGHARKAINDISFNEHTHKNYTLNSCMDTMGMREYENCVQHMSTLMVLHKNNMVVNFVDEWLKWNLVPECASLAINGSYENWLTDQRNGKLGHRHDQSISGLLVNKLCPNLIKTYGVPGVPTFNFLAVCDVKHKYQFANSVLHK